MNLWRVAYDYTYSASSTQDGPYTNKHTEPRQYVITQGDSIPDVKEAINRLMGNGHKLERIIQCEWLGTNVIPLPDLIGPELFALRRFHSSFGSMNGQHKVLMPRHTNQEMLFDCWYEAEQIRESQRP